MPFQAKFAANYPLPSWNARPKVLPKPCLDVSDKLCFGLELSDKFGTNAVSVLNYKVLVLKTNFPLKITVAKISEFEIRCPMSTTLPLLS